MPARERQRLLIVDDDSDVLRAAEQVARTIPGVDTVAVSTVEEAVSLLRKEKFAAIVSDVDFGGVASGFDLAAFAMLGDPDHPVPIALVSGHVDATREGHALALGTPIYEKPVNVREVVERLLGAADAWFAAEEEREKAEGKSGGKPE